MVTKSKPETEQARERKSGRPNFVFILADDLGYADLHCYGGREDCSPNLDKMATEGRCPGSAHSKAVKINFAKLI